MGRVRIVGVRAPGRPQIVAETVGHGIDPHDILRERGLWLERVLSVTGVLPDIVVTVQVRQLSPRRPEPVYAIRSSTPSVDIPDGVVPVRHQRVAAYGLVLSELGLLATQFSERIATPGMWGLPGGGVQPGETAAAAVVREIEEETGQRAEILRVLDLQSDHWIGYSPVGDLEDFHALRLVYVARIPQPTTPVVLDRGGTTASARWVPLSQWHDVAWSMGFRLILSRHLGRVTRTMRNQWRK